MADNETDKLSAKEMYDRVLQEKDIDKLLQGAREKGREEGRAESQQTINAFQEDCRTLRMQNITLAKNNKELHDQINQLKDQITVLNNKINDTEPFVTIDLDNPSHHAHALEEQKRKFIYAQYRVNI